MTPVIAVEREGQVELVDGFKRRAAAAQMGWPELLVSVRQMDERTQWAAMLTLNRMPGALSVLEEALILRELVQSGMTQTEIAQLAGRHKSWVCRRLGLVDRLHPDLVEWVRTGLMSAGTARRLFVLPQGNQLELAAVVTQAELSSQETELLVSLWRKTTDPAIRRFLLTEPRTAVKNAQSEKVEPVLDPRLTPHGKTLARLLSIMQGVGSRVNQSLHPPPPAQDLELLLSQINQSKTLLGKVETALGSASKSASFASNDETNATPTSGSCSPTVRE